jgi:hypothetical protein
MQFQALAQRQFDDLSESRKQLLDQLEKTQLKLFDTPFDVSRYKEVRHLGGTIVAALLVSLGASFWFNMLRNLSNLRPIVAGRVESTEG